MLLGCHVVRKEPGPTQGRQGIGLTTAPACTREQVEADLDDIFAEVHHTGEYPYEHAWCEEGVTSVMLLAYAKRHRVKPSCIPQALASRNISLTAPTITPPASICS
jgi:hypothetical protein